MRNKTVVWPGPDGHRPSEYVTLRWSMELCYDPTRHTDCRAVGSLSAIHMRWVGRFATWPWVTRGISRSFREPFFTLPLIVTVAERKACSAGQKKKTVIFYIRRFVCLFVWHTIVERHKQIYDMKKYRRKLLAISEGFCSLVCSCTQWTYGTSSDDDDNNDELYPAYTIKQLSSKRRANIKRTSSN